MIEDKLSKQAIEDIFALTPMQAGMLFHYLKEPGSDLYFEQLCLEMSGTIDSRIFEQAWNMVVETNDMLRTVFRWQKVKEPVQMVLKAHPPDLRYFDLTHPCGQGPRLEEITARDREARFDLQQTSFRVSLCKWAEDKYAMIVSHHHILYDGWSSAVLLREFFDAYAALSRGTIPQREPKTRFKAWVQWLRNQEEQRHQDFWQHYLKDMDGCTGLSIKNSRPAGPDRDTAGGRIWRCGLSGELSEQLARFVHQHQVTLAALLYAAWGVLLQTYNDSGEVMFGTTVSGRSAEIKGLEEMVGLLINTIPLRLTLHAEERLITFLANTAAALRQRAAHEHTPLVDIKRYGGQDSGDELFDTLLVIENYPLDFRMLKGKGGLRVVSYAAVERAHYDLTVTFAAAGDGLEINFLYSPSVFPSAALERLSRHFQRAVEVLAADPDLQVGEVDLLSPQERREILVDFNDSRTAYPQEMTLSRIFADRARRFPHRFALAGPTRGGQWLQLTYGGLDECSTRRARLLQTRGVKTDGLVAVMVERSLEMVTAIFGILKAGAAYLPIDPRCPRERLEFMLQDSGAGLLITPDLPEFPGVEFPDPRRRELPEAGGELAYVMYTSGSTGRPKGVMVNQRAVVNVLAALQTAYPLNEADAYLFKTSYVFDVSVTELFGWFFGGGRLAVLAGGEEREPAAMLAAIERERISHINFVPSMFRLFVEFLDGANLRRLRRLKYIFLAGEALAGELVDRFRKLDDRVALENIYGPTEATIYASCYSLSHWQGGEAVPIGRPLRNMNLYVLDRRDRLQPVGVPGQLVIAGVGLARGYLNNPDLTAQKFVTAPATSTSTGHQTPITKSYILNPKSQILYRTGDLARWLPDGNIEFLGRIDHQVKIRGFRIELGEIESQLLNHRQITGAVVTARESEGERGDSYLCAYFACSGDDSLEAAEIREYLSPRLPDYMIPSFYVPLDNIPLTASGKVNRQALPAPHRRGPGEYAAPRHAVDERLVEIWSELLGVVSQEVGIDDNFFKMGGHSLKAVKLMSRIHKVFNVRLPLSLLFKYPFIRGLTDYIEQAGTERYASLERAEKREYYPLSSAQKRLYVLQQMEARSTVYNMPFAVVLTGKIDRHRLETAFARLIRRHESLRTSFAVWEEEPVQRVHDSVDFEIEYDDLTPARDVSRAFDLSVPPLLWVGVIQQEEAKYLLMVDMHHIIADGASVGILMRDFAALYGGETLAAAGIDYKDYAQWLNSKRVKEAVTEQAGYWLKEFAGGAGAIPVLPLPTDYLRPPVRSFSGSTVGFEIGQAKTTALAKLALEMESTLFMVLLAAFAVLLTKLCGQEDIVIGTAVEGRRHPDLQDMIGMFVNTLAMRTYPAADRSAADFIKEVRQRTLAAFENQEYPFEDLVDRLAVGRAANRNPLFDVMFTLQNIDIPELEIPGLQIEPYDIANNLSKFDLLLTGEERETGLGFSLEYCTDLFKRETVEKFAGYFKRVLDALPRDAGQQLTLAEIEIMSAAERQQVLVDFNHTGRAYPQTKTVHRLFEDQAEESGDRVAVVFADRSVSYRELDSRAKKLAAHLEMKGVEPETVVGIMVERSGDMIVALLAILKAGAAYLPIDPQYPDKRKRYMIEDCGVDTLVIDCKEDPGCVRHLIHLANIDLYNSDDDFESRGRAHHLAYIIYTSGSTGIPRGVMVAHRNIVRLVKNTDYFAFQEHERILQTGALEFDASTFEIWGALLNGLTLYLAGKEAILTPRLLGEIIAKNDIAAIWLTSPLFNRMLESEIEIFKGLKSLLVGGDALSPVHINRLRQRFPALNIVNGYGPTENTTFSTTFLVDREYKESIPIGCPIANSTAYIVNNSGSLQPLKVAGELWVGGDGVARGYMNDGELTAEKFIENPFMEEGRVYKTGDMARFLEDGAIEFLGRIDQQVKIRGFRVELGEIENRLLEHEKIKQAVVLVRQEADGEKYLCAYVVGDGEAAAAELREYLSKNLPDYMIPAYFVRLDRIPLTANGKVDRKALPGPKIGGSGAYTAPATQLERQLAAIWSGVLGLPEAQIGIEANFFEWGGHSLKATILVSKIHQVLDVNLPLVEVFRRPTIKQMADYIKGSAAAAFTAVEPVEKREYYPLASGQKQVYFQQQLAGQGTVYNIPYVFELMGRLEMERLTDVFEQLIRRHESLRTSFVLLEGEPLQKVHPAVDFKIEYVETGGGQRRAVEEEIDHFIRPFDLSVPPLLRVGLIQQEKEKYLLLMDMHHVIADGLSMEIFVKEFMALYRQGAGALSPLRIQYKDFSQWQGAMRDRVNRQQGEYWQREFSEEIPVLELPFDYPRPALPGFAGDGLRFEIGPHQTEGLKALALGEDTSLFMNLLAIFTILLAKLGGQEVLVVGSPTAGRRHADLLPVIGKFVNTLALKSYPRAERTMRQFLKEVRERTLAAYENQEYQFDDLVESLKLSRDTGRHPLFDVMLVLQNMDIPRIEIPGLELRPYGYKSTVSKFDLCLNGDEEGDILVFTLEYSTSLFRRRTIERWIDFFKRIVDCFLENLEVKIGDIEIISAAEKSRILHDFNNTGRAYPQAKTVHRLFEDQAEVVGDKVAVVFAGRSLSYRELDSRAKKLAAHLEMKGVEPETVVGIMVERSGDMIVALLAILKAGAAYLPIDPQYPDKRKRYMIEDCGVDTLVTGCREIPGFVGQSIFLDDADLYYHDDDFESRGRAHHPAYIIYTSGSTGIPRGVMVEHRNIVRLVKNTDYFAFPEHERILQTGALEFDASTFEIWGALLNGLTLYLAGKEAILTPRLLGEIIAKNDIAAIWLTSPLFNRMLESEIEIFKGLKSLLVGGDALSPVHINRLRQRFPALNIVNGYGPTENTTFSTTFLIDREYTGSIPIGSPIANSTAYIVAKTGSLQPVKVAGELWVGGDGVARGYVNDAELTAEKFIENPFKEAGRVYKTGDMARFLEDGTIEFLGRIDQQVKIRGFRVELGEIENRLLEHEKIEQAVVLVRQDDDGEKYLCAYVKGDGRAEELRNHLQKSLPGYMVPSYFVRLERLPLTANGKIDRRALPGPGTFEAGRECVPPRDEVEKRLLEIWRQLLKVEAIGIYDDFFEIGGHSLKVLHLLNAVQKEFAVKLDFQDIFRFPTVAGLHDLIGEGEKDSLEEIERQADRDFYEISYAQKRLWLLQNLDSFSPAFNLQSSTTIYDRVEENRVRTVLAQLIRRHESFRTYFKKVDGRPVQVVEPDVPLDLTCIDLSQLAEQDRRQRREQLSRHESCGVFDLEKPPLFRATLVKCGAEEFDLILTMHHLITDGWSMEVLEREFFILYEACKGGGQHPLRPLKIQYRDYACWHNRLLALPGKIRGAKEFWESQLNGRLSILRLPYDYPKNNLDSKESAGYRIAIPPDLTQSLRRIARANQASLFMVLLAGFYVLLHRLSAQDDLLLAVPGAARQHQDLENVVGFFVNTLVLRNRLDPHEPFIALLERVQANTLQVLRHQSYPLELVCSEFKIRYPDITVFFNMSTFGNVSRQELKDQAAYHIDRVQEAKFDLVCYLVEYRRGIEINTHYYRELFKPLTIEKIMGLYVTILDNISREPARTIKDHLFAGREGQKRRLANF